MTLPAPSIDARALVTGASQGIGMAIARDLAKLGHNLILVARRADILAQLADELERKHSIIAEVYPCDLADPDQLHKLIDDIRDRNINIIINSAGIASFGPFINQDWNYETTQFALNATAVFELTHAVLPGMIRRKTGAICNVGSAAGNIPIPNNATYVLTKAGVNAFTEALHYELKPSSPPAPSATPSFPRTRNPSWIRSSPTCYGPPTSPVRKKPSKPWPKTAAASYPGPSPKP